MRSSRLFGVALLLSGGFCLGTSAFAQTEEVISLFGHGRGRNPGVPLMEDRTGNLYGGTWIAGKADDPLGTVFELVRHGPRWGDTILYNFDLRTGGFPEGGLIEGGRFLFGTAGLGGEFGCGMVYRLALRRGLWRETTLHGFSGSDGCVPAGDLARDPSGNLYGVTGIGGANNDGTVFELTPAGNTWSYQVVYSFSSGGGGNRPQGIIVGAGGTLFGTAAGGSANAGVVFQLSNSGGTWSETVLHSFGGSGDGSGPSGNLVADATGNLYGTTTAGGADNAGTVYEMSPSGRTWTETVLYSFTGGADGNQPVDGVALHNGTLYGATASGGTAGGGGTVFKLMQNGSSWTETVLHSFPQPGGSDGSSPTAHPIVDASGAIFGTTIYGGHNDHGTAYRIVE
jgi:uncharacterized repeat protein (TIGR03803 family)